LGGGGRVIRGGSWNSFAKICRPAYRGHYFDSSLTSSYLGFRPQVQQRKPPATGLFGTQVSENTTFD